MTNIILYNGTAGDSSTIPELTMYEDHPRQSCDS